MIERDPYKWLSAEECLDHCWFNEDSSQNLIEKNHLENLKNF